RRSRQPGDERVAAGRPRGPLDDERIVARPRSGAGCETLRRAVGVPPDATAEPVLDQAAVEDLLLPPDPAAGEGSREPLERRAGERRRPVGLGRLAEEPEDALEVGPAQPPDVRGPVHRAAPPWQTVRHGKTMPRRGPDPSTDRPRLVPARAL